MRPCAPRLGSVARLDVARGYTAPVVPLSAVLIAQNEDKKIGDALASVSFCD